MILQTLLMAPSYVFGNNAAVAFHPGVLIPLRALLAALLFLMLLKLRNQLHLPPKSLWKPLLRLTLLGITLNQTFFLTGLRYTSPAHSAIIYSLTPLTVLALAAWWFKTETLSWNKTLWIIIAIIGTILVLLSKASKTALNPILGNILTFIGLIFWSFFMSYARILSQKIDPIYMTAVMVCLGALFFLPIGLFFLPQVQWDNLGADAWFGLGYLVVVNGTLAYLLLNYALSKLHASQVALYINTQPVLATLISIVFGKTSLTLSFVIGAFLVLLAVWKVNR